jgi:catechol 2,3-dioxygenase-like lactoylglutathione lyase family enzyme
MGYSLDHVALPSRDIARSVRFYVARFGARVLYQDKTWAFLEIGRGKVALVSPRQHPAHIALRVTKTQLREEARKAGKPILQHRDGSRTIYLVDPQGNHVELIHYPRPRRK